jgi:hypothetical protein
LHGRRRPVGVATSSDILAAVVRGEARAVFGE